MTWTGILGEVYKKEKREKGLDPWKEWDKPDTDHTCD